MSNRRLQDLIRFYSILNQLEKTIGGPRALADCRGRMKWPARGVYFFREAGENRSDTGEGPCLVRVGTPALKAGGSTTLWGRGGRGTQQDRGFGYATRSMDRATDHSSAKWLKIWRAEWDSNSAYNVVSIT